MHRGGSEQQLSIEIMAPETELALKQTEPGQGSAHQCSQGSGGKAEMFLSDKVMRTWASRERL